MTETNQQSEAPQLESGTYEILRNRLRTHGDELRDRLNQLNSDRKDVFGSIDLKLLNTERITTDHNCVPRDMVAVGSHFLFGYNVHFGLKTERNIADVFAVYAFDDDAKTFTQESLSLLDDATFEKDFQDVYRYYKNATFSKFFVRGPHLFMVFQVGKSASDIKSFKWLIQGSSLRYLDNRSDHEVRYPSQHEFEWKKTTRDMQQHGLHPHISIDDRVFVETVGGDLTIKVEDNTESGEGIYSEPVDDPDQTLDDADIFYAFVGHTILLKIRPYQESQWRYIVFNQKIQRASRVDSIADACVLLPDDHGLIFSNGYYLQSGEQKTFDSGVQGLVFERRIASPNGEDTLYVFYQPEHGEYVLLGYNVISQEVDTPVICSGFTMFHGGEMVLFKAHTDPQKHHAVQVWQTPYVGDDYQSEENTDSYLFKIGNRDIVRGMAECHEILNLIEKDDSYSGLYLDLVKLSTGVLDSYFWINHDDAANLAEPLTSVKSAASSAVDEFEKVVRVRKNTAEQSKTVTASTREILNEAGRRRFDNIDAFVKSLASMRQIRGEIIGLKDLRYIDLELVESLEDEIATASDQLSHRCVEFLLREDSLKPYADAVAEEQAGVEHLTKVTDAKAVDEKIAESAHELEMLIEIVSNLKIDDATHRTTIIDNISAIFAHVNTARASLKRKIQELASVEGSAEFSSQLKLLNQSVVNYLDVCDSPEKCEEYLTKLMVQIEELEGKFAEFDDFIVQLAEKREEIASAFESRRMQLVEKRNKRANALAQAADRILKGVKNRVESFEEINDIHGYFASDLMIDKVRNLIAELEELGDSVKVDDIQSRLKTTREDAVRQLKDKRELYEDGDNVIRFGNHRFSVNTQVLDLTTVLRDDALNYHLTGTDFYEPVDSEALEATREVWSMEVVSENRDVYRAEFLAYQMLLADRKDQWLAIEGIEAPYTTESLLPVVQKFMGPRYREGYTKGVHDNDAAILLAELLNMDRNCGLLRFSSQARTLANLFWSHFGNTRDKKMMASKLTGYGTIAQLFSNTDQQTEYINELRQMIELMILENGVFASDSIAPAALPSFNADEEPTFTVDSVLTQEAAEYLFAEITEQKDATRGDLFAVSQTAATLYRLFHEHLHRLDAEKRFSDSIKAVSKNTAVAFELARDWANAFLQDPRGGATDDPNNHEYLDELALNLLHGSIDERAVISATTEVEIDHLVGTHNVIVDGQYTLRLNAFLNRLETFQREIVPLYESYHDLKSELVDSTREGMKLAEFQPRVLSSFVRNRLIDEVYLPILGDNLAKQIGATGDGKRTDRQGLLLLISPPGYGKTTLMEYIANRLGIIFMKINGPALGHDVTSLDPSAAPNAGAREEVEKLNLALEMGDNVMIYLDDIQHCHTEFLQKFISLCDAQRKIEGVWKGKTRTYDFRGKKVAVVMAGNPYTESGEKFQIPDMLSNRADIYNLGEIIGDSADAFDLSYIENALTSNPILGKLAARSQKDVYAVVKMAERQRRGDNSGSEGLEFEASYSMEELNEFVSCMVKLMRVRDVVLRVNQEYITSAAQHDDYRTEPPFLLQGSYRNMNRIAEKVLPVMNDTELESLINSSYQNDAQTLTSGTEANLLKFKELLGSQSNEERERWNDIKKTYKQNVKMRGIGSDDKVGQVLATLSTFNDGLDSIKKALVESALTLSEGNNDDALSSQIEVLTRGLDGMTGRLNDGFATLAQLANRPIEVNVEAPVSSTPIPAASATVPANPIAAPSSEPEPITIINRLPKTVYKVLESQFELMEGWLRPIRDLTAQHHHELKEVRPLIEQCMEHYQRLLNKLEAAHDRDD